VLLKEGLAPCFLMRWCGWIHIWLPFSCGLLRKASRFVCRRDQCDVC
jgi:hypothetical protein